MFRRLVLVRHSIVLLSCVLGGAAVSAQERQLNIIGFGAHPDDNEIRMAGTAALWARQGHRVKFVSVTNGDIGHHRIAGGPLAQIRRNEVEQAARILDIETEVLDIHDGELMPTLEHRRKIVRLIREWEADLVFTHRPYDYHPDHRYTGVLVQDAAFMVTVPFFCPDVPALDQNPAFFYYYDRFQKPYPFNPDVIVAIDNVMPLKLQALEQIESQFLDWWQRDNPIDRSDPSVRTETIRRLFLPRCAHAVDEYPHLMEAFYGEDAGDYRYGEAFELCEYGRSVSSEELRELFPIAASR